jgi:hypothetical protein
MTNSRNLCKAKELFHINQTCEMTTLVFFINYNNMKTKKMIGSTPYYFHSMDGFHPFCCVEFWSGYIYIYIIHFGCVGTNYGPKLGGYIIYD